VYPVGYVLSEDNQHLNVEGHRRMADRMLAAMRANGVVPGRAASTR
jgi:hypothetical protein